MSITYIKDANIPAHALYNISAQQIDATLCHRKGSSTQLADHCWHGACQGAGTASVTHFSKVSSASCEKFMYKAVMPWYKARRRWMSLFSVKA